MTILRRACWANCQNRSNRSVSSFVNLENWPLPLASSLASAGIWTAGPEIGMIVPEANGGYVNQPIHFSPYSQMPQQPAPEFGADTCAVLAEYGFTSDEIAKMRDQGAI